MPCIPTLLQRSEVREQHKIEGSVCGDVCAACCCTCCATIQVANELDAFESFVSTVEPHLLIAQQI